MAEIMKHDFFVSKTNNQNKPCESGVSFGDAFSCGSQPIPLSSCKAFLFIGNDEKNT